MTYYKARPSYFSGTLQPLAHWVEISHLIRLPKRMSGLECPTANPGSSSLSLRCKEATGNSLHCTAPLAAPRGVEYLPDLQSVPGSHTRVLARCWKSALNAHRTTLLPFPVTCRAVCAHTHPVITAKSVRQKQAQKGPRSPPSALLPTAGLTASPEMINGEPDTAAWLQRLQCGCGSLLQSEASQREKQVPSSTYICMWI